MTPVTFSGMARLFISVGKDSKYPVPREELKSKFLMPTNDIDGVMPEGLVLSPDLVKVLIQQIEPGNQDTYVFTYKSPKFPNVGFVAWGDKDVEAMQENLIHNFEPGFIDSMLAQDRMADVDVEIGADILPPVQYSDEQVRSYAQNKIAQIEQSPGKPSDIAHVTLRFCRDFLRDPKLAAMTIYDQILKAQLTLEQARQQATEQGYLDAAFRGTVDGDKKWYLQLRNVEVVKPVRQ